MHDLKGSDRWSKAALPILGIFWGHPSCVSSLGAMQLCWSMRANESRYLNGPVTKFRGSARFLMNVHQSNDVTGRRRVSKLYKIIISIMQESFTSHQTALLAMHEFKDLRQGSNRTGFTCAPKTRRSIQHWTNSKSIGILAFGEPLVPRSKDRLPLSYWI